MARLQLVRRAESDLDRLTDFLLAHSSDVAQATTELVVDGLQTLRRHPRIGRLCGDGLRELIISRGKTGYVALYRYDEIRDIVRILAIRHQRELGNP
jgi:Plasmid stabilization system protein